MCARPVAVVQQNPHAGDALTNNDMWVGHSAKKQTLNTVHRQPSWAAWSPTK